MSDKIELLPCECGGNDQYIGYVSPQAYWVACNDCGNQTDNMSDRESAIMDWNRRAALAKQPAPVAEAQEPVAISNDEADDLIAVRRGLIAAACSAIDKKRDAPKTLAQLRNLAVHGFSLTGNAPPAAEQPDTVAVPRELLERAMYAKDGRELIEANRELRALLAGGA